MTLVRLARLFGGRGSKAQAAHVCGGDTLMIKGVPYQLKEATQQNSLFLL